MSSIHIRAELVRANEAARAAALLLDAGLLADAVSRSYYATLHAARAALLVHDVIAESHAAVRRLFGSTLVRPGLIEAEWGRALARGHALRAEADYDVTARWESEQAAQAVRDARAFVERIVVYIEGTLSESPEPPP